MAPVYADHPFPLLSTPSAAVAEQGTEPTMFHEMASDMAHVHNIIFRGLNAIYLQAPHIAPSDERSFCKYILQWHSFLSTHHTNEETHFFPALEAMTGEKGIMDVNVGQHATFHDGVDAFVEYVRDVLAGKKKYDGAEVCRLVDAFGSALANHLSEEIPTIAALERFGLEKMKGLPALFEEEAQKAMRAMGMWTGLPWVFHHIDKGFENGRWEAWPPAPALVVFLTKHVFYHRYADWWKFAPCGLDFRMKPLFAVPENQKAKT